MRLSSLTIENFRGFESITVDLDPQLTLLIGRNGAGKTAFLEAASIVRSSFVDGLPESQPRDLSMEHARRLPFERNGLIELQPQLPVLINAIGELAGQSLQWGAKYPSKGGPVRAGVMQRVTQELHQQVRAGQPIGLPLIAFYGTQRLRIRESDGEKRLGVGNRFDGYADCLAPAATAPTLARWMEQQTLIELQTQRPHVQLAAVQAAVRACIDGIDRVWFDVAHDEIRLQREARMLSFSMLSDGYQDMVALVADLARRAAILNPQHGERACELTDGVVLIDELELHLHPSWQRRVIADLRRTFPRVQFIATTHSPQVVASVRREQVRLLHDNRLVRVELFVEGRDTNGLLEDVFGVPSRPPEAQAEIDEVFRLLADEQYQVGRARIAELTKRLGPDDSAIVRANWVLDTEAPIATE